MASKFKDIGEGIVGAIVIIFSLLTPFLRPWRVKWGATDAEVQRALPGDDLVKHPKWQYTNAITIESPVACVWFWLVQIGQGRGGFYNYEWLQNLIGCDMHNTNQILQEFQHLEVGDSVRLHPKMPGYPVAIIKPDCVIVLHADTRTGSTPVPGGTKPEDYFASTWVFFLDKLDDGKTRLISRFRSDYNPRMRNRLFYGTCLVEPISTAMQRKMLKGIKQRVEAAGR
jgi:hypothetical protein